MGYEITVRHGSVNGVRKLGHNGDHSKKLCGHQYYCCCEEVACKKVKCTPPPAKKCCKGDCNPCKCPNPCQCKHDKKKHHEKPYSVCKTTKCQPCVNPCDPCDKPYRVGCYDGECCADDLCITPPDCLLDDKVYRTLFCILKECILHLDLDKTLAKLTKKVKKEGAESEDAIEVYEDLLDKSDLTAKKAQHALKTCTRVTITLPDGTVVLDTSLGDDNDVAKGFTEGELLANHNTRVAIMHAQELEGGVDAERKYSTTTGDHEKYVAIRLGTHLDSIGTARISAKDEHHKYGNEGCDEDED